MDKIASFTIDHEKMSRGIFVSRQDKVGDQTITTFDIRIKLPNREPVMDNPALHTIEHLGATYLRKQSRLGRQDYLFRPYGMPNRMLCSLLRRSDFTGTLFLL